MAPVVKNLAANAGDEGDVGLIPGWGRSPGGGHGNPLQYFCLENPMDREVLWAQDQGKQRLQFGRAQIKSCVYQDSEERSSDPTGD